MKRVREMIDFFAKTFLKDKIIGLMTILMFVLCLACILLIVLESSKSEDTETTEAVVAKTTAALKS